MAMNLILKSQSNAVFHAVREAGFDASDFEWEEIQASFADEEMLVSKLVHKPSQYFFEFGFMASLYGYFSPGSERRGPFFRRVEDWDQLLRLCRAWLGNLSREVLAPDLWGTVAQATRLAGAASSEDTANVPFHNDERRQIAASLREIMEFLSSTQQLNDEHKQFVRRQLEYLREASERMGRKDWLMVAIGVLTGIVIQLGLSPDKTAELFRLAGIFLHDVVGGGPLALP